MKNIFTPLFLTVSIFASAQDGVLDGSFQTNGVVNTYSGPVQRTSRQKLIILPGSNKMLQTFTISNGTNTDFGIARYNEDGSLDGTFAGGAGYTTIDISGDDEAYTMALQSDGKIIVAGTSDINGTPKFSMVRLTTAGVLDGSFAGGGKVTTNIAAGTSDFAYAIAIRPDNSIILGGQSITPGGSPVFSFALVQYTSGGVVDGSFGTGGKVTTTINGFDQINSLSLQSDGKLVAAGFTGISNADIALARYNVNGTLDNAPGSFGTGGIVTTDFGLSQDDVAMDVKVLSDGKILAAGYTNSGSGITLNEDFALVRYLSNGTPDASFNGGKTSADFGANDRAYSFAIQSDNRIVVLGYKDSGAPLSPHSDFAIARFTTAGALDNSFGGNGNGKNTVDFGTTQNNIPSNSDFGFSVALGPGYILAGGITDAFGYSLALARFINTSSALPVSLFSFTGMKLANGVQLNWETAGEQELSRFEVERSADGRQFTRIGEVRAAGNSVQKRNYSLLDAQPLQPVNVYRLKMIDDNGTFTYSRTVIVKYNTLNALTVFPNPVKNTLNIQLLEPAGPVRLEVVDAGGRTISTLSLQSNGNSISTAIDMSRLQKGVYFIRVNEEVTSVVKE